MRFLSHETPVFQIAISYFAKSVKLKSTFYPLGNFVRILKEFLENRDFPFAL